MDGYEEQLRRDPYQREKNQVVANQLLPLFEDNPTHWDAICYLNLDPEDAHNELRQYLRNWYDHVPAEHKPFVGGVLDLLEGENGLTVADASVTPAPMAALRDNVTRTR